MTGSTYITLHLLNNLHVGLVDAAVIIQTLLFPREKPDQYCLDETSVLFIYTSNINLDRDNVTFGFLPRSLSWVKSHLPRL